MYHTALSPQPARSVGTEPATDPLTRYAQVRSHTVRLASALSAEDCSAQSMPDASPVKWHLAHTTWFFETFVLEAHDPEFVPFNPAFRVLFNSYYDGVGARHPRAQRGALTRPSLYEVLAYRSHVDMRMARLLGQWMRDPASWTCRSTVELGLQHEQQHQELMLTDLKHLFSCNPMHPAYDAAYAPYAPVGANLASPVEPIFWLPMTGGLVSIGHAGDDFAFDNEKPAHQQFVPAFALASRLVTHGEFAEFVECGGYRDPLLWLAEGWDWRTAQGIDHPMYWHRSDDNGWDVFTLAGLQPMDAASPAVHLSYYEADAYARWRDARLPTEAQWEFAAQTLAPKAGPQPVADGGGQLLHDMFGVAWQWTQSSYAAYPGFRVAPGAVGEYNGKFMVNQYVLRGSSSATPPGHARTTYRNFFPATARWQFSGIRLARDL
jgi:ergothioneine biosynthesis protein EgtB